MVITAFDPLTYEKIEKVYNSSNFPNGLILPDDHGYAIKVTCSSKLDETNEWNFMCPTKDPDVVPDLPCIHSSTFSASATEDDENLRTKRSLRDWLTFKPEQQADDPKYDRGVSDEIDRQHAQR